MAKKTRIVYRDTKTGWLVKKDKWKRSKAHGGTRYKRQIEKIKKRKIDRDAIEELKEIERAERREQEREAIKELEKGRTGTPLAPLREYINAFQYENTGKSFDIITVATNEHDAYEIAKEFLRRDPDAQRIVKSDFRGWKHVTAEGKLTTQEWGSAEYRAESELL